MKINSVEVVEEILQSYLLNASKYTGDNLSLSRMFPLLEVLDNPQNKLKIIHIAGTSGKTSTAYYADSILSNSGLKVGLTVSPHVDRITERVQINSVPLSEEKFCDYFGEFLESAIAVNIKPSYHELLIVFAYWVFDKEKVDYAVVETGLGGLLDSTNVANSPDKICVITDIGFDHMNILGNTISEIAFQKAGIIHQSNQVYMYEQSSEIMNVIEDVVASKNAKLNIVSQNIEFENNFNSSDMPLFQKRNFNLALNVCRAVSVRDKFSLLNIEKSASINIPGRMDTIILEDKTTLIMDGAHNGQKIATFVNSYKEKFPNQKASILLALKTGKEYTEVIDGLFEIAESFILTSFKTSKDLPVKALNPEELESYIKTSNTSAEIVLDLEQAYKTLLDSKSEIKLVIGSFYLVGQVRKFL